MLNKLIVRQPVGLQDYQTTLDRVEYMFNNNYPNDELWVLQHPTVYTAGLATKCKCAHDGTELIKVNRRGSTSLHSPGQLACYVNIDMRRRGIGPTQIIEWVEDVTIDILNQYGIQGSRYEGIPGIFVNNKKIMNIGLEIREKKTSFGFALNVSNDLSLFNNIDLCGYKELRVTNMKNEYGNTIPVRDVANKIIKSFVDKFNYQTFEILTSLS